MAHTRGPHVPLVCVDLLLITAPNQPTLSYQPNAGRCCQQRLFMSFITITCSPTLAWIPQASWFLIAIQPVPNRDKHLSPSGKLGMAAFETLVKLMSTRIRGNLPLTGIISVSGYLCRWSWSQAQASPAILTTS